MPTATTDPIPRGRITQVCLHFNRDVNNDDDIIDAGPVRAHTNLSVTCEQAKNPAKNGRIHSVFLIIQEEWTTYQHKQLV